MSHFCLLSDPGNYISHDYRVHENADATKYWLDLFENHFESTLKLAGERYGKSVAEQINIARQDFAGQIAALRKNPTSLPSGKLDVIELCNVREACLRKHALHDPFGHVKQRENKSAAALYPQVVRKLHAMNNADKWLHLIECVFAGNLFDLGSECTFHLADNPTDFLAHVEQVKPRPWLVDDYDRLAEDVIGVMPSKWSRAVIFIDNAGSDFILGVMPLARELALAGTQIVIAANELPTLNDITADEAVMVLGALSTDDVDLAALIEAGMFEVVSTGNDIPLIDLSDVSDELNEAAADADLVILEGMGRSVESNFDTTFSVDCLNLAMLKDPYVASRVGGGLFDCICKYTPVDD